MPRYSRLLLLAPLLLGMVIPAWPQSSPGRYHALRLRPGQDLKVELTRYLETNKLAACAVVTCVGSLTESRIRFADEPGPTLVRGPLEIVTLVGCGGMGRWHLHLTVADNQGKVTGGHLADGSIVRTTAEIVLVELTELEFHRTFDPDSGYQELEVKPVRPRRDPAGASE